ncbi:hypothetical protein EBT16_06715, partial [bacterium]|nr:hypothetical protein [bacterium]
MLRVLLLPLSFLLNAAPHRVKLFCGTLLGALFFHAFRFRRKVVLSNLELAFGKEKQPSELRKVARQNYNHYALVILEWIESFLWTADDFRTKTDLFWEPIQKQMELNRGGILLTSHLGNWEFAIQAASAHGMPCDIIVKRQKTQFAQKFLTWFRTRFGARVIFESGTIRDIFDSLGKNRFVVFVLDQFMGPPIGLPVKFFEHEAGTAAGLALITEKSKNLLFTAYSYRGRNGKIQIHIEKLEEPAESATTREARLYRKTQWYNDVIENQVRRFPEQWLWLHKRWKPFEGKTRWELKTALMALLLGLLLQSCSSPQGSATPTGIELPPDPTIAIPVYGQSDSTERKPAPSVNSGKKGKKVDVKTKPAFFYLD